MGKLSHTFTLSCATFSVFHFFFLYFVFARFGSYLSLSLCACVGFGLTCVAYLCGLCAPHKWLVALYITMVSRTLHDNYKMLKWNNIRWKSNNFILLLWLLLRQLLRLLLLLVEVVVLLLLLLSLSFLLHGILVHLWSRLACKVEQCIFHLSNSLSVLNPLPLQVVFVCVFMNSSFECCYIYKFISCVWCIPISPRLYIHTWICRHGDSHTSHKIVAVLQSVFTYWTTRSLNWW